MKEHVMRRFKFAPYGKGLGPTFTLELIESAYDFQQKKERIHYRLKQHIARRVTKVVFEANDFCASPLHSADSKATALAILGFLTLRPGDVEPDYFKDYTLEQLTFRDEHAESLAVYCAE